MPGGARRIKCWQLLYFLLFLRIYCGLDDGSLAVWTIPEGGLVAPVNTPDTRVRGLEAENICNTKNIWLQVPAHDDKCTIVKCHPLAEGVVASVGQDHLVKVSCDWLTRVLSCDWSRSGTWCPRSTRRWPCWRVTRTRCTRWPGHSAAGSSPPPARTARSGPWWRHITLHTTDTVCSGSTTPAPARRRCGRAGM